MLKDYRDGSRDVIVMDRGTTLFHYFPFPTHHADGRVLNPYNYNFTCEVRMCSSDPNPKFMAELVTNYSDPSIGIIAFREEDIHTGIREERLYWRLIADSQVGQDIFVFKRGEILLRGM